MSETSSVLDVTNEPGLNWHRMAEQDTAAVARRLRACRAAEIADGKATFLWRLRVIVHVRALCEKVRLPRSHSNHIPSTEWKKTCRHFGDVGPTHAAAIVQRKLADPYPPRHIMARVAEMERVAAERHRPLEYPKIGTLLRWFPDPRAPPRQKRPDKVTAQDAHISELEFSDRAVARREVRRLVRQEHLLTPVILAQNIEIERLRGFKVIDDRRPRAGLDLDKVGEAWMAELKRTGALPKGEMT